jgi:hypothetical protein
MAQPIVTIVSVDRVKVSDEVGMNKANVVFTFDQNITQWTVNVMGVSYDTGTIADSGNSVTAGTQITAEIDFTELYSEGDNQVNIYGRNSSGEWSLHNQEGTITIYMYGSRRLGTSRYGQR